MSQDNDNNNMYVAAGAASIASPFLFALMSCSGWSSDWPAVKVRDPKTSAEKPLANAWVYWKKDSAITVLRADADGVLHALDKGKTDKTAPWDYNTSFRPKLGEDVELLFSRGARPLPDGELAANPTAFRTVKSAKAMTLDDFTLALAKPKELSVWPLFWELPVDRSELHHQNFDPAGRPDYLTAGLAQKTAVWNGTNTPAVVENAAAPAAPDSVTVGTGANATTVRIRPRERGLAVEGKIDKGATGVRVKVYSASQSLIRLRAGIDPAAQRVDWVAAAQMGVVSASADTREFKATIFFENAADAFGPVQVFVISEGLSMPVMDSFLVYLTGVQAALVDDYPANANGSQRGPVLREADEVNIVDFVVSPQATSNALRNQTRLRRMARYQFANAQRPLNPALPQGANNPSVIKPQLPLWMAELHLVGMNDKKLGEFMSYRYFKEKVDFGGKDPPYPATLKLDLSWRIKLYWDGPDENSANFNVSNSQIHYSYSHELAASQKVRLFFRDGGKLTDSKKKDVALEAGGSVPGAFREQPALPEFPVAGRRQPKVVLSGQTRHWGRHAAVQKDAAVIEFQPRIVDGAGAELVAGGNGSLECSVTAIDLLPVDVGLVLDNAGVLAAPPAADPHARLPTFRVVGRNPDRQDVLSLVEALVDEYYNAHSTVDRVALLSQACWRTTARLIFDHEARLSQFDYRASHRSANDSNTCYYGNELDMPIFGWPHGYGVGQIDNFVDNGATRGVNTGEVWSFVENLRTAVRIIMEVKAQEAYNLVDDHLPTPVDRRTRAVYQREIVRRYNGGREFRWNGNDWEISPSQSLQGTARLAYPNQVLGTNVAYSVTQPNGTVTYHWPVTFAQADYGPDT